MCVVVVLCSVIVVLFRFCLFIVCFVVDFCLLVLFVVDGFFVVVFLGFFFGGVWGLFLVFSIFYYVLCVFVVVVVVVVVIVDIVVFDHTLYSIIRTRVIFHVGFMLDTWGHYLNMTPH